MAVADRFDRIKPSPAIRPVTTLIPDRLETAGRAGGANVAPKPAPKPSPATVAQTIRSSGATTGEAGRFAAVANKPAPTPKPAPIAAPAPIATKPNGSVVAAPGTMTPPRPGWIWDEERGGWIPTPADEGTSVIGGDGGSTLQTPSGETTVIGTPPEPQVDAQAMLAALINQLLEGDFIGFQGQRAAELRRLQNLRNQLYGDAEMGSIGSIERQRQLDANARRRLAASRAVSGMLAGGAYAGTQRGLGTIQRAEQDFGIQEMERPFREQVAADRLREFGLEYAPAGRIFNLSDFGAPTDMLGGWTRRTFGGQEAAARARQAAIQQLAQRGIQI